MYLGEVDVGDEGCATIEMMEEINVPYQCAKMRDCGGKSLCS